MAIPASHIALKMDDEAIADDHLYDMRVSIFSFGSFFSRELCLRSMNRTLSRYNKCLDSSETALVEHEEEGNSDIDQLGKIFAAFGTPKPSQWPDIKYLPDYVEYQYVPGQPLRQLFPMASADALDLLSKMFTYDPKARISALQALEHRTSWCSLNSI